MARPGSSVHTRGHTAPPWGTNLHLPSPLRPNQSSDSGGPDCLDEAPPWAGSLRGWTAPSSQGPQQARGWPGRGCASFTPMPSRGAPRPRPPELPAPTPRRNTRENGPIGKSGRELQGLLRVRPRVLLFVCCFAAKRVLRAGVHYSGNWSGCLICKIVSAPWHCHFVAARGLGGLPKVAVHQPQSRDWTPLPPCPTLPRAP